MVATRRDPRSPLLPPLISVSFSNLGVINNTCWRGKSGKREASPSPPMAKAGEPGAVAGGFRAGATAGGAVQHPWRCSAPPRGLLRSKAGGKRGPDAELLGRICPSSLHPSASLPAILQPGLPPSLGLGAGIARHRRLQSPLLRGRAAPTARPKVCRPQAFLTASPSHPLWLPRLLFTGAALLAPGPGACAWVETASRWSYFFTFLGGRGGRFGKKPLGPGKQWEGVDLQGGWLAWPCFCGVLPGTGGLGGETEARSIPPRAVSWLMVKSLTLAPSLRGCNRGDGVVQITLP